MKDTVANHLVRYLERRGVRHVFGLCGHTNIAVLSAMALSRVEFINVRHEQVAAHAADGYARATGKASVLLTHLGPGLTNAATGVANAALDCIPMVVIAGDVPSHYFGKHPHQEVNLHADGAQYEIYRPFVKRAWRVDDPNLFAEIIDKAFLLAESGQPGPVLVDVPMDVFSAEVDSHFFTRLDNNQVESWDFYATVFDWHFKSGDSVHAILDFNPTYERLFERFEIAPGVVLQPGEYRFTRFRTSPITSASKRRVSGGLTLVWGNYWSGQAEQVNTTLTYKLPPWFSVGLSTNQTFARLPEGHFITRIVTSNVGYAVSPSLSFSNLIQYDNRSRNLGWQSRMRWTLQPGSDLFFAFNQGWVQEEDQVDRRRSFRAQDSKISSKIQYSIRF